MPVKTTKGKTPKKPVATRRGKRLTPKSSRGTKASSVKKQRSSQSNLKKTTVKRRRKRNRGAKTLRGYILKKLIRFGLVFFTIVALLITAIWNVQPSRQQILDADRGLVMVMDKRGDKLEMVEVARNLRVPASKIPKQLKQAFLSIEDRRFYYHFGVDPISITANIIKGLQGQKMGGGSTLTQQLAKNLFLSSDRSLWRKVKEMVLAFKLEYYFSKDRILEMYLNNVYFGDNTFGVEAATQHYFSKRSRDLNLYEMALLAGTVKGPNRYHIRRHLDVAAKRGELVLQAMVDAEYIEPEHMDVAISGGIQKGSHKFQAIQYQWLRDWIVPSILKELDGYEGRVRIFTTLNTEYQTYAERAIRRYLHLYKDSNTSEAALVSLAVDGAVRAMAGGANYSQSQLNRCLVKRQPASTFKPFIYLAGLEAGLDEGTLLEDSPLSIDGWTPRNYDGRYLGPIPMSEALAQSRNAATVALYQQVGYEGFADVLYRLGIEETIPHNPAVVLGTWEVPLAKLTNMYRTIANGGARVEPYGFMGAIDSSGNILAWREPVEPVYAVDMVVVAKLNHMLQQAVYKGTGSKAAFGGKLVAGKTGTSQGNRDALFLGYSDILTTGVWMGNDDNSKMKDVSGGNAPALIWRYFMANCHDSLYE
jgi:penicillin-binding protein 1A